MSKTQVTLQHRSDSDENPIFHNLVCIHYDCVELLCIYCFFHQNTRNNRAGEISSAIYDLIAAVKPFHEEEDEESTTDNMATKIMEVSQRHRSP